MTDRRHNTVHFYQKGIYSQCFEGSSLIDYDGVKSQHKDWNSVLVAGGTLPYNLPLLKLFFLGYSPNTVCTLTFDVTKVVMEDDECITVLMGRVNEEYVNRAVEELLTARERARSCS